MFILATIVIQLGQLFMCFETIKLTCIKWFFLQVNLPYHCFITGELRKTLNQCGEASTSVEIVLVVIIGEKFFDINIIV